MMVEILPSDAPDTEEGARNLLGRSLFIHWPHMAEAQVAAVSDGHYK